MKFLHRLILVFCLILCPFMVLAEKPVEYLSGLPEIPRMEGLIEGEGSTLNFDKPEGRIVSVFTLAMPDVELEKIYSFYALTLPQLGWEVKEKGVFTRGTERFSVIINPEEDGRMVQFLVEPIAAPMDRPEAF